MKSLNLLIIFVACCAFSTVVISVPASTPFPPEIVAIVECQNKSDEAGEIIKECIQKEFTEEELNETRQMYNETKCLPCKHFCRKYDAVLNCVRIGTDILKNLSSKSQNMVPILGQLTESIITSLCENDAEILTVNSDELNKPCFRKSWSECKFHVNFMDDLDRAVLCDYTTPEEDIYTPEYICQKTKDLFECTEKNVDSCSMDVKNSITSMKNKIINLESCAKYF